MGYSPGGCKESDMTERLTISKKGMLLSEVGIMCVQAENTKENTELEKRHGADCPKEPLGTPNLLTPPP